MNTPPPLPPDVPGVLTPFPPLARSPEPNPLDPGWFDPSRRRRRFIAWSLIAVAVAAIAVLDLRDARRQIELNDDSAVQLEQSSRFYVGRVHRLANAVTPQESATAIAALRERYNSPADQVRLAPVEAELIDSQAAVDSMDKLLATNPPAQVADDARLMRTIYLDPDHPAMTPEEQNRLVERYGWFGQMAISTAPGDPRRREAIAKATRTWAVEQSEIEIVFGALAAGCVLLAIGIIPWALGKFPPAYRPGDGRVGEAMLEGFVVYLLGTVALSAAFSQLDSIIANKAYRIAIDSTVVLPVAAALGWVRRRGVAWHEFAMAAGLSRGRGVVREIWAGIVGYIAGMPLIAVGFVLAFALTKLAGPGPGHPLVRSIRTPGATRIMIVLLTCVFAPITEEMFFRGMLFGSLRSRHGWIASALLVSFIFAAIHPQGWRTIPALGAVAIVLAALREQRDSLIAPMTVHALNNFSVLAILVLTIG